MDVQEFKKQAGIQPYECLERFHRNGSGYMALCPFYGERNPSLSIFCGADGVWLWKCHCAGDCGGGDVIDFVQKKDGLDFKQAVQKIAEECGISLDNGWHNNPAPAPTPRPTTKPTKPAPAPDIGYDRAKAQTQVDKAAPLLIKRGIDLEVARQAGVGYFDYPHFGPTVALHYDKETVKFRAINPTEGKKFLHLPGHPSADRLYGIETLDEACKEVHMTESELDCLTVRSHGYYSISPSSATACLRDGELTIRPEDLERLERIPNIYLWSDMDAAGWAYAAAAEKRFPDKCFRVQWQYRGKASGDAKDVGELYAQTPLTFRERFEQLKTEARANKRNTAAVAMAMALADKFGGLARTADVSVGRVTNVLQNELRKVTQVQDAYPPTLGANVLNGIVGEFVKTALPFTEADENCLAYQFLTAVGNIIGRADRKIYARFGADEHRTNLFLLTVGETSCGKGQGINHVRQLMRQVDPEWTRNRCKSSAASGEAIVTMAARATGEYGEDEEESDDGAAARSHNGDGRVLLLLRELSVLWNSMRRDGSNTSGYLRDAYDGSQLENNRARSAVIASDYLMSAIGHSTPMELIGLIDPVHWHDGVVNRFIFAVVARSKTLTRMTKMPDYQPLAEKLRMLLSLPYRGEVDFTPDGGKLWDDWVMGLPDHDGILGAAMQRVRPNALRVALILAFLDESRLVFTDQPIRIEARHVQAASEIVERGIASVQWFLNRPAKIGSQQDSEKIRRVREAANKNGGQLSGRDLAALLSHDTEEARKRIATEAGLCLEVVGPGEKGGRPRQVWVWKN